MRVIIFRGKRTDNGEWIEGDLLQLHDGRKYIVNNKFGACIDDKGNFINTEAPFVCTVNLATVGQYTGFTDKNGKRIFEGDIVKAETHDYKGDTFQGAVIFKDGCFCIEYHPWDEYLNDFSSRIVTHRIAKETLWHDTNTSGIMRYTYEVVGNIHDVPKAARENVDK